MTWVILIAYIVTVLAVFFAITLLPIGIIGGLLGRMFSNPLLGFLGGGIITWQLLDILWLKFAGGHIPVAAFGLSFLTLGLHGQIGNEELNENAKTLMGAEMLAIVLVCIYTMIVSDSIRWY